MKIRRFSEIDLARLVSTASESPELLLQALWNYETGGGAWSYDPVRGSTPDILRASTPLHGALAPVPWEQIKGQIQRACRRGQDQIAANLEVGKLLFDAAERLHWSAAKFQMGQMPIGNGESVRYWNDVVLADEHGPFVAFFDHRRDHGVANAQMRRVVFSMQNIWIRARYPDLAEARLALVQFPCRKKERSLRLTFSQDNELLSFEDLDRLVRTVYEKWAVVLAQKLRQTKRTGTNDSNPFGF